MNAGYSLMLDMDEDSIAIIDHYFSLYDICEIKLDLEDIASNYFDSFLAHVNERYNKKVSFHLKSSFLENIYEGTRYCNLINRKLAKFDGYFIIHIPSTGLISSYHNIGLLSNLPHFSILYENDKNITINEFENFVERTNFNTCLDIGHAYLNNIESIDCFLKKENKFVLNSIKEIHLHNVINNKDHQLFEDSIPEDMRFVFNCIPNCTRIILEIKKIDIFSQTAKEQYQLVKNVLSK